MRTPTLRTRLTLWYTLALIVVLVLFGVDVLWGQGRLGVRRVDRELDGLATAVANVMEAELKEHVNPASAADEASHRVPIAGRAIAILDARGVLLAASWDRLELTDRIPSPQTERVVWTARTASGPWRIHAQPETFDGTTGAPRREFPLRCQERTT